MNLDDVNIEANVDRCEPRTMASELQLAENPLVSCACGRIVNADMMRAYGDGFACDACHETMFRNGDLSREEFARSHGASDSVILMATQLDAQRLDQLFELDRLQTARAPDPAV